MKKFLSIFLDCILIWSLAACVNTSSENTESVNGNEANLVVSEEYATTPENESTEQAEKKFEQETETTGSNILVAYFSLVGEQYSVGVIEEGNTAIIANMIAEQTGADLFKIEAVTPYPQTHSELLDISRQERADNARPEISRTVDNMVDYDVVFIGYPNWWGDMPMIVYNFLESYDFDGKTIVPFCTHGGSGLSGTESTIANITGASMIDGFAIAGTTAQNDRDTAKDEVVKWLLKGGFIENATQTDNEAISEDYTEQSTSEAIYLTESEQENNQPEVTESIDITMAFRGTKVTATLENSETSQDFISLLPLHLHMTRFYDREYADSLGEKTLSQNGNAIETFENGDVTYYIAGNTLAVFFDKSNTSQQSELIRMGKVTSDLKKLIDLDGDAEVFITLAKEEGNIMTEYDFSVFSNVELLGIDVTELSEEKQSVLYQQARYCQAMTQADTNTMREITSEDMTFTHMSGRQQTREEYFTDIENGDLQYFSIGIENPVVEVNGDRASVTYTSVLNANAYGARGTYRMSGTHWYELRNGEWTGVNSNN